MIASVRHLILTIARCYLEIPAIIEFIWRCKHVFFPHAAHKQPLKRSVIFCGKFFIGLQSKPILFISPNFTNFLHRISSKAPILRSGSQEIEFLDQIPRYLTWKLCPSHFWTPGKGLYKHFLGEGWLLESIYVILNANTKNMSWSWLLESIWPLNLCGTCLRKRLSSIQSTWY